MSNLNVPPETMNRVQVLQAEIEQLQASLSAIEQQTSLISGAINSLESALITQRELESKKTGDDILIPIGGSNLVLCTVKDPDHIFLSLGSGVTKRTTLTEAITRNKKQLENLKSNIDKFESQFTQFSQMVNVRRQELIQIAQQYQLV
ncbi:MAG: prefoldin subunit alpha [Candidatus Heimdallarchaeota archaeon]|nr:prefoldin subunit alpha [Candidatus Heimdallarchaeota archaeon]